MKKKLFLIIVLFLNGSILLKGQYSKISYLRDTTTFDLFFDYKSSELKDDQISKLNQFLDYLQYIGTGIKLEGNADSIGGKSYNQKLVDKRLKFVEDLIEGKSGPIIKTINHGLTKPLATNQTEEGRKLNRYVRVTIYSEKKIALIEPEETINNDSLTIDTISNEEEVAIDSSTNKDSIIDNKEEPFENLEAGKNIVLEDIQFYGGTAVFFPKSMGALTQLWTVMVQNPEMVIEIQGHVCCDNDMKLSKERGKAVYQFLRRKGIDKKRMSYTGFSNTRPLVVERTERDRQKNRRVEVKIVSL